MRQENPSAFVVKPTGDVVRRKQAKSSVFGVKVKAGPIKGLNSK